jgi:hypothetical protein
MPALPSSAATTAVVETSPAAAANVDGVINVGFAAAAVLFLSVSGNTGRVALYKTVEENEEGGQAGDIPFGGDENPLSGDVPLSAGIPIGVNFEASALVESGLLSDATLEQIVSSNVHDHEDRQPQESPREDFQSSTGKKVGLDKCGPSHQKVGIKINNRSLVGVVSQEDVKEYHAWGTTAWALSLENVFGGSSGAADLKRHLETYLETCLTSYLKTHIQEAGVKKSALIGDGGQEEDQFSDKKDELVNSTINPITSSSSSSSSSSLSSSSFLFSPSTPSFLFSPSTPSSSTITVSARRRSSNGVPNFSLLGDGSSSSSSDSSDNSDSDDDDDDTDQLLPPPPLLPPPLKKLLLLRVLLADVLRGIGNFLAKWESELKPLEKQALSDLPMDPHIDLQPFFGALQLQLQHSSSSSNSSSNNNITRSSSNSSSSSSSSRSTLLTAMAGKQKPPLRQQQQLKPVAVQVARRVSLVCLAQQVMQRERQQRLQAASGGGGGCGGGGAGMGVNKRGPSAASLYEGPRQRRRHASSSSSSSSSSSASTKSWAISSGDGEDGGESGSQAEFYTRYVKPSIVGHGSGGGSGGGGGGTSSGACGATSDSAMGGAGTSGGAGGGGNGEDFCVWCNGPMPPSSSSVALSLETLPSSSSSLQSSSSSQLSSSASLCSSSASSSYRYCGWVCAQAAALRSGSSAAIRRQVVVVVVANFSRKT